MFLALREIRRAKVRFALLISAVGLLVFLILTQQALQNGLLTSFVGAIERQSAPVLVYSVDGQRTLQGSVIPPPLEASIREVDGVDAAGRIGQSTFTVTIDGGDPVDGAVIGYEDPELGAPDELAGGRLPDAAGEAVGSSVDYAVGDEVRCCRRGTARSRWSSPWWASPTTSRSRSRPPSSWRGRTTSRPPWLPTPMRGRSCPTRRHPAGRRDHRPRARRPRERRERGGRCAHPTAGRRRVARRRAGAPVVPGDLPALRPRGPARHRAVLPDHHLPEGRRPDPAAGDRRPIRRPGAIAARPGRDRGRRGSGGRHRAVLPALASAGRHHLAAVRPRRGGVLVGPAARAGPAQRAGRRPPGARHRPHRGHRRGGAR